MKEDNVIIIKTSDYVYVHREGIYVIKEEIRELERLLKEARQRLDNEYYKKGGRSWYEYIYSIIFGY